MNGDGSILAGLIIYLGGMLVIGFLCLRYMRSLDDYVLGGRRLGPWVSAISERASGESAWFLLGLPGAAYGLGLTEYWSVIGIAAGILASWTFIALPLRRQTAKMGCLTLPDYLEARFQDRSRMLRVLSMVVILVFYTAYVSAQLFGAGKILNATFGIDHQTGILIGATVVVLYTILGGFLAVAWTDLVQGLLMTFVAVLLPLVGIISIGGPGELFSSVSQHSPQLLSMTGGQIGGGFALGAVVGGLSWGLGYLGQPHLLTRYMAIRDPKQLPKGGLIAMGWTLLSYWGAPMIGLVGIVVLGPDLADPEAVMPLLAKELMPGWIAGMMIAGATAAMMSSADSQLLVATSTLIEDIYVRLIGAKKDPKTLVRYSRIATIAIGLIAWGLAWHAQRTGSALIDATVSYAWTGLGASFGPPLVFALWWKGTTRYGALAGMTGGMLATIAWKHIDGLQGILDIKAAAVLISALLVWGVSLMTRKGDGA